jgi:DNA-binding NtrC family response regulator
MVVERPSRKLLIVDDEPLVRQTLTYVLQDEYDVLAVASGEEAIEASTRESYPVVILDLCMEGLSGIETLQKLKEIRENQNIIILTAYESTDSAIAALNLGAFNYITKPFERAHLKRIISRGFDVYEQQLERAEEMRQRFRGVHNRFFSLLCQEFNTPLNVILGFSEMLTDDRKNLEFLTWVQHIKDAGNHLHELLMEIVD